MTGENKISKGEVITQVGSLMTQLMIDVSSKVYEVDLETYSEILQMIHDTNCHILDAISNAE